MLGAVIHPKNYILPLLRPHFCGRFPEENFMIYDAVHQAVLLQEDHKARLLELAAPLELPPVSPPGAGDSLLPWEPLPQAASPRVIPAASRSARGFFMFIVLPPHFR